MVTVTSVSADDGRVVLRSEMAWQAGARECGHIFVTQASQAAQELPRLPVLEGPYGVGWLPLH
jgi:hypothetical protein